MKEHPKFNHEDTLCVEMQKQYGRTRYSPCNELAYKFTQGLDQKTFLDTDLKWIKSLGYTILVIGPYTTEFE